MRRGIAGPAALQDDRMTTPRMPIGKYRRPNQNAKPVSVFRDAAGLYWLWRNKRQPIEADELPRWSRVYGERIEGMLDPAGLFGRC